MIITPSVLKALFTGYKTWYRQGIDMAPSEYTQIASTIKSESASNTYGWLGQFPQFREWVGDRVVKDMSAHGYQVFNKQYEATVGVKGTDIEDDNIGTYAPIFQEMGRAAQAYPNELVFDLLASGFESLCFDGQNFFDTDHPVGEPKAQKSVSNFAQGDKTPWFLLDTSRALKPLIFQERHAPKFVSMVSDHDESVFMRDLYRYGVKSRSNVGFGFWQMAYASQQDLTMDNFDAAYDAMSAFKSDEGRPLGITPTVLVVPTKLRKKAQEIVKDKLSNGSDNTNAGIVDVLVSKWLR